MVDARLAQRQAVGRESTNRNEKAASGRPSRFSAARLQVGHLRATIRATRRAEGGEQRHERGPTVRKLVLAVPAAVLALVTLAAGAAAQPAFEREHLFVGFGKPPGAAERALVDRHGGTVRLAFPEVDALAIDLAGAKIGDLARENGVRYVEKDPIRKPLGLATSQLTPSMSNGLYGLLTTGTTTAHGSGLVGTGEKACVADTGIDKSHADIIANWAGGYDAFAKDRDPDVGDSATETHGTHVAGTMAAVNNNAGVFGVAYAAKIWLARVLGTQSDGSVSGTTSQVMDGVKWLATQDDPSTATIEGAGCKVINMSLGGGAKSRTEENLYKDLYNKGTLIVAAAGNDGATRISYPAAYPVVLSVAAVDASKRIASFSNTGRGLDISAPGVLVLSSVSDGHGSEASVNAGSEYRAFGMEYAGKTSALSAGLVDCGLATSPCAGASGKIALVQRGSISFAEKVENAMAGGAAGAIIYNNAAGDFVGTLGSEKTSTGAAWIPAVSVSDATGAALKSQASATLVNVASSWDHYDGTSMATPHVSAIALLVRQAKGNLTPSALEDRLKRTTDELGAAGYDTTYGYGHVNAARATAP